MCKSQKDGGQRCAAHTRPRYQSAAVGTPEWDEAAVAYASTREGHKVLTRDAAAAASEGDFETEARLRAAAARGEAMREANKEAAVTIARHDLSTWEPANIDGELARLYGEAALLRARRDGDYEHLKRHVATHVLGRNHRATATRTEVEDAVEDLRATPAAERNFRHNTVLDLADRVEQYSDDLDAIDHQMTPFNKEFDRRGGWNRAFLVTNGNGHVHRSMSCSTCRPTTQYHWVTEFSDHDEAEIVEAAGARACTCCYPTAPVETFNRPTRIFSPEERTQQEARVQRAAAAEERHAKKVANALTADGSEFKVECTRNGYKEREHFKTERAATTWMVSNIATYRTWAKDRTMDASMAAEHDRIIEAIATKHGKDVAEVKAEIEKKVAAKIRRYNS